MKNNTVTARPGRTGQKSIAFLLAVLMGIAAIPALPAYANLQNPVTDLSIVDESSEQTGGTDYVLNLRWTQPAASQKADTAAAQGTGANLTETAEGYDIRYRNLSQNEHFTTQFQDTFANASPGAINRQLSNLNLSGGSLYEFKATPYHVGAHRYTVPGTSALQPGRANMDTTITESTALYLTDIAVTAAGSGNQLTVQWDNPTFQGKNLFTGYTVYYMAGGSLAATIPDTAPNVVIGLNDPNLKSINGGKQLQYTITDSKNLNVGASYAVKVEPMYGPSGSIGKLVRDQSRVTFNNVSYPIAYTKKTREYRTNDAYIKPALNADAYGYDEVKLTWSNLKLFIQTAYRIEIYSSPMPDMTNAALIGTLDGSSATDVNFWMADRPSGKYYYQIKIWYNTNGTNGYHLSEIAEYDPTTTDFTPYKPTILEMADNNAAPLNLSVIWQAFGRNAYSPDETAQVNPKYNKYIDPDVIYDVWVTDDLDNFNRADIDSQPIASLSAYDLSLVAYPNNGIDMDVPAYQYGFTQYLGLDAASGALAKRAIADNKIYYVKIVARRDPSGQESQPAMGSYYIPALGDVSTRPNMMPKPPLRIYEDQNGLAITDKSIGIQWDTNWWEAYDEVTQQWYVKIGVDAGNHIVFGDAADTAGRIIMLNDPKFQSKNGVADSVSLIQAALGGANGADTLPLRSISLPKDVQYEAHVVPYDSITANGLSYDDYVNMLLQPENAALWQTVTPAGDTLHPYSILTRQDAPTDRTGAELMPNTAYVIFFRPYGMDGSRAYYPSYISATTLTTRGPIDIDPTTPVLEAVSSTSTSVTLRWKYADGLAYTLAFSDIMKDYSAGGVGIAWDAIQQTATTQVDNGNTYMYYTVTGLFPLTDYYFWIRSTANNTTGATQSPWSNPVNRKTKDLDAPKPPDGLGLAAQEDLNVYNKTNGTQYVPVTDSYMILEWMRDVADLPATATGGTRGGNTSNSAGAAAAASVQALPDPLLTDTYMAKFNDLIANKTYYARAKTVFTVSKGKGTGGALTLTYHYVVQLSETSDFTDVVEITVPTAAAGTAAASAITAGDLQKESVWSATVSFLTGKSTAEYDGDKDDRYYPLPAQDFEIIFDKPTNTLTYRFRSNQTGKNGNQGFDNNVDQRFISRLVREKVFDYAVDLSKYNNKLVDNRVVEMPYSVYSAFTERKIDFRITANAMTMTIKPGALATGAVKGASGFGTGALVRITINETNVGAPGLMPNEGYAANPQKVKIEVVTPKTTVVVDQTAQKIPGSLKLSNRYSMMVHNIGAYYADANTGGWQRANAAYDNLAGTLSFDAQRLSYFAAIAKAPLAHLHNSPGTVNTMYNVSTKLDIKDMGVYNANSPVNAIQFNNIIAAVAKGSLSLTMNTPLSSQDYQSLGKSGILVSGSSVSREAGISALVKLYELKTKTPIKDYGNVAGSGIQDISSAATQYHTALLKAEKIGFLGGTDNANPKALMAFGELFAMLDIVMQDSSV